MVVEYIHVSAWDGGGREGARYTGLEDYCKHEGLCRQLHPLVRCGKTGLLFFLFGSARATHR